MSTYNMVLEAETPQMEFWYIYDATGKCVRIIRVIKGGLWR